MKKVKRRELVKAIREAVQMLRRVGFDDECEPSFKRAWRRCIKKIEATVAAEPK